MTTDQPDPRSPDASIEELLKLAGPRPTADEVRARRVRTTVHAAWQQDLRDRARRRWMVIGGAMAAAVIAAVAFSVLRPERVGTPPLAVARITAMGGSALAIEGRALPLRTGDIIHAGDLIRSGSGAHATFALDAGGELRLDESSVLRWAGARQFGLDTGAVYVTTSGAPVRIDTAIGQVRDIGTAFEVSLRDGRLRVRVREGAVEYSGRGGIRQVPAGMALTASRDEPGATTAVAPCGADWAWVMRAGPRFTLEGRTVQAFLDWVARESGCRVRFADRELASKVGGSVVHGSVDGLTALEALDILETVGLRYRVTGAEIVIEAAGNERR
jgi:ferric-dicitrate binding protein FerR (iron transport regulator)